MIMCQCLLLTSCISKDIYKVIVCACNPVCPSSRGLVTVQVAPVSFSVQAHWQGIWLKDSRGR